jgi:GT2 family glycosyltransferase
VPLEDNRETMPAAERESADAYRLNRARALLSVVIACFNGAETLDRQLAALLGQRAAAPFEVIVADNGSTDGSRELAERYRRQSEAVRIVDASDTRGLAHARNVGAAAAVADALAFCDQDDEVAPGWVDAMAGALAKHQVVAGRLEHDALNQPWAIAVRGRPQSDRLVEWEVEGSPPFAFGCTLGVRRAVHETIGGFDETFVRGCEDVDYCWRLQSAGYPLVFEPAAVTHYRLRHSLRGLYRQALAYGESEAQLFRKHRALGLPRIRRPWLKAARIWVGTARALARSRSRAERAVAVWLLGQRVGRAKGSVKHRVLFP